MKKELFFFLMLVCFFSCKDQSNTKNLKSEPINYIELSSFVNDSLPKFITIDKKYFEIIDSWESKSIIESTSLIVSKDPKTLPFFFESLKLELDKVEVEKIPYKLKVPQIIGRFRVYKTEVYKINEIVLNQNNIKLFKENLISLAISYNALINMINITSKDILEKNTKE
ncbi:MAG: hypothetical protein ACJ0OB_02435 [Flavobacteriaceae bacterium]